MVTDDVEQNLRHLTKGPTLGPSQRLLEVTSPVKNAMIALFRTLVVVQDICVSWKLRKDATLTRQEGARVPNLRLY